MREEDLSDSDRFKRVPQCFGPDLEGVLRVDAVTMSVIVQADLLLEELRFYKGKLGANVPSGPTHGCFHCFYGKRSEKEFIHYGFSF